MKVCDAVCVLSIQKSKQMQDKLPAAAAAHTYK